MLHRRASSYVVLLVSVSYRVRRRRRRRREREQVSLDDRGAVVA